MCPMSYLYRLITNWSANVLSKLLICCLKPRVNYTDKSEEHSCVGLQHRLRLLVRVCVKESNMICG